jgi:hypothetical protein
VQKGGKVAPTAENLDMGLASEDGLPRVVEADIKGAKVGVDDLFEGFRREGVQLGGGAEPGTRAGHGDIDVEVGDGGFFEPVDVLFYPLGRAEEAVFFGVPGAEDAGGC